MQSVDNLNENFPPLALPVAELKTQRIGDKLFVFDSLRKKWVRLTPEEWVRQHYVSYLCRYRGYPEHAFANEVALPVSIRKGRTDTLILGTGGRPWAIVEYKAAQLSLQKEMWSQLLAYNLAYNVDVLCLTNGKQQIVCLLGNSPEACKYIPEMPLYSELRTHYNSHPKRDY